MTLSLRGIHCDLGQALKDRATEKLTSLDEKYFGRGLNASVTISKTERKRFRVNIIQHTGNRDFQADAASRDAHRALDKACEKLAKQMRRTKQRVRDDHRNRDKRALDRSLNESLIVPSN